MFPCPALNKELPWAARVTVMRSSESPTSPWRFSEPPLNHPTHLACFLTRWPASLSRGGGVWEDQIPLCTAASLRADGLNTAFEFGSEA